MPTTEANTTQFYIKINTVKIVCTKTKQGCYALWA